MGQNVHSGTWTLPTRGFFIAVWVIDCEYKHYSVQKKQIAETTKVFCLVLCGQLLGDRYTIQSLISPKSSRSLWICITSSRSTCQHVQLPLKISMQPTSTESTTAPQHPVHLVSPRSSAHPFRYSCQSFPSTFSIELTDKDEDERTAWVKGSSLNLIKINFTMSLGCDSRHVALMSYSVWLGFMKTHVEWSQICDVPAN